MKNATRTGGFLAAMAIVLGTVIMMDRMKDGNSLPDQTRRGLAPSENRPITIPSSTSVESAPIRSREEEGPPSSTLVRDHFEEWISVSPVQRKILMSQEAMEHYEVILTSLDLPADRMLRLRELIVEREECAQNAESLSKDAGIGPDNTLIIREQAEASFDHEIGSAAGDLNVQKVRQMLSLDPQLAQVVQTIGRDLILTGHPLDADQILQLAQIYKEMYAPSTSGRFERTAGFDAGTGLAMADRQTLARASAILTPEQLDLLEGDLAKTTTTYANASR